MSTKVQMMKGHIVLPEFSKSGGVHTESTRTSKKDINDGAGIQSKHRLTKTVDDVARVKEAEAITTRSYYLTDRHCVRTPLGYWVEDAALPGYMTAMEEVFQASAIYNTRARAAGSDCRVVARVITVKLDVTHEEAAERLAQHILERLAELVSALRMGDRKAFESSWERCHNLEKLAVGIQREAIQQALEGAKGCKALMLSHLRAGCTPADAGEKLSATPELESIEATQRLFI